MIRIGVLGSIGSGKSYVAKLFGYPVFNADKEVAKLYKKDSKCCKKIKKALPDYNFSFPINKNKILEAILDNKNNLKKIIKIIHPEVRLKMNYFIKKNNNKKIIILDIPLLLENKLNKKRDILIFVDAKQKLIEKKLGKRVGGNSKIFKIFKNVQLPIELKKKKSNFVIKNNFTKHSVRKNVKKILKEILLNA